MRDFELSAIALIAFVLLYDFNSTNSRARPVNGVKCIEKGDTYSYKINSKLNWSGVDFSDDWTPGYHIFNVSEMRQHEFEVIHTFERHNKVTFKLHSFKYFEVKDQHNNTLLVKLDPENNERVIIDVDGHNPARWTYMFW